MAHSFGNLTESSLVVLWTSRNYTLFRHRVDNALFPSYTDCDLKDGSRFRRSKPIESVPDIKPGRAIISPS